MRRLFVAVLFILAAGASLAYLVRLDAGYVLLQFHGLSVETTIWVALLALLLLLFGFYYLGRLLVVCADLLARVLGRRKPGRLGGMLGSWHARRRGITTRGTVAFMEGRWRVALRLLARGARSSDTPLLNHLLAARASEELGDRELAQGFYQLAAEAPGAGLAVRLARARAEMRGGRLSEALALLDVDDADHADAPALLRLQLEVLERLGDWQRIAALLPEARRYGLRAETALAALEERSWLARLEHAGASSGSLQTAWKALPSPARQHPALLTAYAAGLARAGFGDDAAKLLSAALRREWNAQLVRAYALLQTGDARARLKFAESLLAGHGREPQLLLALGRLALGNRLWGKAREYLESSLANGAGSEACAELARLYQHLGEHERASAMLQRAVKLSVGELPTLPMPESRNQLAAPVFNRLE